MTEYIRKQGLLPSDEIDEIWERTPKDIIEFQEGYEASQSEDPKKWNNMILGDWEKKDYRTIVSS